MIHLTFKPSPFSTNEEFIRRFTYIYKPDDTIRNFVEARKNDYSLEDFVFFHSRLGKVNQKKLDTSLQDNDAFLVFPKAQDPATIAFWTVFAIVGIASLAGGIYLTKGLLSGNLFGAQPIGAANASGDTSDSPTYGWDGIRNTADAGIPLPIFYGEHDLGGNIINSFVINEYSSNSERSVSYVYLLIVLGEGEFAEIAGRFADEDNVPIDEIGRLIRINDNPVDNIPGTIVSVRMGSNDQDPIPDFHDLHNVRAINMELLQGVTHDFVTEGTDIEKLIINVTCNGLIKLNSETGETETKTVRFKVRYKRTSEVAWEYDETQEFRGETQSTIRKTFYFDLPAAGEYDIQVVRVSADSDDTDIANLFLTQIDEIVKQAQIYPNNALLGLRIPASENTNGNIEKIIVHCKGLKVETDPINNPGVKEWSDNAIWIARDYLLNQRYGLGHFITSDVITGDASGLYLYDEAAYIDELVPILGMSGEDKRFRTNIIFDSISPSMDNLQKLMDTADGMVIWSQGRIRFLIRRPVDQVGSIGAGQMLPDSFKESFLQLKDSTSILEIQFHDEEQDYIRDIVAIEDGAILATGRPIRKSTELILGVTTRHHANRLGRLRMLRRKYNIRLVEFKSSAESIKYTAGAIIGVAKDVMQWGIISGRLLEKVDSTHFRLNKDLTINTGETYFLRVTVAIGTGTKEIVSPPGFYAAGDVIEIDSAFGDIIDSLAGSFTPYVVGLENIIDKPFRVIFMKQDDNHIVSVKCEEYNVELFDEAEEFISIPPYSSLPNPRLKPQHVDDLVLTSTASYEPKIMVSWDVLPYNPAFGIHGRVDIYLRKPAGSSIGEGDGEWQKVGESQGLTFVIENTITPLKEYGVKVVAISTVGISADFATAPEESIIPTAPLPPNVTGLEILGQGNDNEFYDVDVQFAWKSYNPLANQFPIGSEPAGFTGGFQTRYFRNYEVNILSEKSRYIIHEGSSEIGGDPTIYGFTPVRIAFTQVNRFTYSNEMNFEDHRHWTAAPANPFLPVIDTVKAGWPVRDFTIMVRIVDIFGQTSPDWTVLAVSNPIPEAVENARWVNNGDNTIFVLWDASKERDLARYVVRVYQSGIQIDSYIGLSNSWVRLQIDGISGPPIVYVGQADAFSDKTKDLDSAVTGPGSNTYFNWAEASEFTL